MELIPGNTLINATPQEGRELAIVMARKTIGAIQPDGDTRQMLRPGYASDAEALTMAAHVGGGRVRNARCRERLLAQSVGLTSPDRASRAGNGADAWWGGPGRIYDNRLRSCGLSG